MRPESSHQLRAYGLALVLCLVATAVAWVLDAPSSCFLLTLVAVSLYGGRRPAYVTVLISSVVFYVLFLPPPLHLRHSNASLLRIVVFIGMMLLTEAFLQAKHRSDLARLAIGEDFRSLAETSPDGIFISDEAGCVIFANPALLRMFGLAERELMGRRAADLLPGFQIRRDVEEFLATRADGSSFYVEATCGTFGEKATVFLRDVSDRKAADERLRRSEASLRLTLDTIPGLVYTCTPEGKIEYANDQVSHYLGNTVGEVRDGAWEDALHPEEKRRVVEERRVGFRSGTAHTTEYRLRRYDGVFRSYQTSVRPLKDDTGSIIRWYGLLTDIEERRQIENSLRNTQAKLAKAAESAAISEFAAAVVHEISQPLSAMVANGQACLRWLASTPPNTADGKASVERIVRDGKDAAQIIQGLRSLFRRSPLKKTRLDLHMIVAEVVSLIRERVLRDEICFTTELSADLPAIAGDKIQLLQVLMNLVTNAMDALQAAPRPRQVGIRAFRQQTAVLIEVFDNGPVLPDFAAIFDPFVTTKAHGLGMGLAICRSIIKAHEGQLWGSANPSGGTVFSFTLPCAGEVKHET